MENFPCKILLHSFWALWLVGIVQAANQSAPNNHSINVRLKFSLQKSAQNSTVVSLWISKLWQKGFVKQASDCCCSSSSCCSCCCDWFQCPIVVVGFFSLHEEMMRSQADDISDWQTGEREPLLIQKWAKKLLLSKSSFSVFFNFFFHVRLVGLHSWPYLRDN